MLAQKGNNIQVYLATHNQNKVNEILKTTPKEITLLSLLSLKQSISWVENGKTFYENALIKAKTVFNYCKTNTLAEDSGLVIEALGGKPGIHSKRYSGENSTDEKNISKVLKELNCFDGDKRKAYFYCCLVYIDTKGKITSYNGKCKGSIPNKPMGQSSFGYDPIFIPDGYKISFAQMTKEEKNRISHRSIAIKQWINSL